MKRKTLLKTPSKAVLAGYAQFAKVTDEGFSITLLVSGMHCASCMMLIENALTSDKRVRNARVNFSTKRLKLDWQGKIEDVEALVKIVTNLGYGLKAFDTSSAENKDSEAQKFLLRCIAVSGFASGNIMLFSVVLWSSVPQVLGIATQDFFHVISMIIGIPTLLYAGRPFFRSAWSVLKNGHTNMDVPISIALILATLISIFQTFTHGEHTYFDSVVMLLFFLLIGRYLDARAKDKARDQAFQLLSMAGGTANVVQTNGKHKLVAIRDLKPGMVVLVAAGENVPADGEVIKGSSEIDASMISGETLPIAVVKGAKVFAGTNNIAAAIQVRVSKASEDSLLSEIVKLMETAEQGQARYVRLADKAAKLYTPIVHAVGLLTFIGWLFVMQAPWQEALMIAATVLIITCPCALGLAVPVVQVLASGKLMKQGILPKSGDALEKLAEIDVVVFDKTGTLTIGKPQLVGGNYSKTDLQVAAAMAASSKHPLSVALSNYYEGARLALEVKEFAGKGLQTLWKEKKVRLGKREWCGNKTAANDEMLEIWLDVEGKKPVRFEFADNLRADAREVVQTLLKAGKEVVLLSGDRKVVAAQIAKKVGISNFKAELSPKEKCIEIEEMKRVGKKVLMVGDGLNDAPALRTANVSISPASAMDITQNSADIVFQGERLSPILEAEFVAQRSNQLVKQNFALSVVYNILAIPLAVAGYVTPLVAAIAMSGSSIVVIANSFRLNRMKRRK